MMPLTFAGIDEVNTIKKVGGKPDTKHHLENLGFVPGTSVVVLHKVSGNIIVGIKDTRIALNEELAKKIMI